MKNKKILAAGFLTPVLLVASSVSVFAYSMPDFDFKPFNIDKVITEKDWDILSSEQIDIKLKKAGLEPIGDVKSPLYKMTPKQVDALSDAEFEKLIGDYYGNIIMY